MKPLKSVGYWALRAGLHSDQLHVASGTDQSAVLEQGEAASFVSPTLLLQGTWSGGFGALLNMIIQQLQQTCRLGLYTSALASCGGSWVMQTAVSE